MSSCLSSGGRTYGFDLEIVKSQSTSTTRTTSHSSSPSSTVSESINSPLAISTRKPRTPRKRPNQTYNEAAALLSTVYPNIFSPQNLTKPSLNHTKAHNNNSTFSHQEFSEFLPPSPAFDNTEFLINQQVPIPEEKPSFRIVSTKTSNSSIENHPCQCPITITDSQMKNPCHRFDDEDDFDAESILDEEMEEGIDSIMGNLSVKNNNDPTIEDYNGSNYSDHQVMGSSHNWNFDFGFGICRGVRAFRRMDDCDYWWRFPTVDVLQISPKLNNNNKKSLSSSEKKIKKKKKVEKIDEEEEKIFSGFAKENSNLSNSSSNSSSSPSSSGLLSLKLNYDEVLNAWSDRGSPFSEEIDPSESDAIARLAQMDSFWEIGGIREASVMRYREKRRSRLFAKKIRYQVRKVNADRRPRMKARSIC